MHLRVCVRAYALLKVGSRTGRQLSLTAAPSTARTRAHTHRQDGVYGVGKAHMYPSSGYNLNNSTLPESERASRNQDGATPAPAALRPNPPRELCNKLQPVFRDLGFLHSAFRHGQKHPKLGRKDKACVCQQRK